MDEKEKDLTFGEYLQARRSELGISMRKFAEKISASAWNTIKQKKNALLI